MESLLLRSSLRLPGLLRAATSTTSRANQGILIIDENCYNDNNIVMSKRCVHFEKTKDDLYKRTPIVAKQQLRFYKSTRSDVKPSAPSNLTPEQIAKDGPVKFTTSEAYLGYKASRNFYGDDREVPDSHNLVIAGTGAFAFLYLIFLRDEQDEGGALSLFRPVHETVPDLAIPLLQATIAENKKFGQNTSKLEKKLAEYLKEPDRHGGGKPKLIEN